MIKKKHTKEISVFCRENIRQMTAEKVLCCVGYHVILELKLTQLMLLFSFHEDWKMLLIFSKTFYRLKSREWRENTKLGNGNDGKSREEVWRPLIFHLLLIEEQTEAELPFECCFDWSRLLRCTVSSRACCICCKMRLVKP